jgi:hypothetical protein
VIGALVERGFSAWAIWTWFESRSAWLGGRTPAQALRERDLPNLRRALNGLTQE